MMRKISILLLNGLMGMLILNTSLYAQGYYYTTTVPSTLVKHYTYDLRLTDAIDESSWGHGTFKLTVTRRNSASTTPVGKLVYEFGIWIKLDNTIELSYADVTEASGSLSAQFRFKEPVLDGANKLVIPVSNNSSGSGRDYAIKIEFWGSFADKIENNVSLSSGTAEQFVGASYRVFESRLGINLGAGVMPSAALDVGGEIASEGLEVNGTIRSKEVIVEATGWPDYVFKPDYDLAPLSELEAYVREHGHLPGIPAKEVVEADGQDLGEIQKNLLQKIEELTLYVIELKKENTAIREELNQLKETNNQ